ncbi:hypothetical protein FOCC_FOCC015433 [Frankliniella occidentalis]|nr:hypothetical protein FOCC_FOCC015433 [Frankliniella occidentalis]
MKYLVLLSFCDYFNTLLLLLLLIPIIVKTIVFPLCVRCVLQQLKDLEENFILIELPNRTVQKVSFFLSLVLGDNLGLNERHTRFC